MPFLSECVFLADLAVRGNFLVEPRGFPCSLTRTGNVLLLTRVYSRGSFLFLGEASASGLYFVSSIMTNQGPPSFSSRRLTSDSTLRVPASMVLFPSFCLCVTPPSHARPTSLSSLGFCFFGGFSACALLSPGTLFFSLSLAYGIAGFPFFVSWVSDSLALVADGHVFLLSPFC